MAAVASFVPIIVALLLVWKLQRSVLATLLITLLVYLLLVCIISVAIPFFDQLKHASNAGSGDGQELASSISENIVGAILRMIVEVPILIGAIFVRQRLRHKS